MFRFFRRHLPAMALQRGEQAAGTDGPSSAVCVSPTPAAAQRQLRAEGGRRPGYRAIRQKRKRRSMLPSSALGKLRNQTPVNLSRAWFWFFCGHAMWLVSV